MLSSSEVGSRISRAGWLMLTLGAVSLFLLPARAEQPQGKPSTANQDTRPNTQPSFEAGKFYVTGTVIEERTRSAIANA